MLPCIAEGTDVQTWLGRGYFYVKDPALWDGKFTLVKSHGAEAGAVCVSPIVGRGRKLVDPRSCYIAWPRLGSVNVPKQVLQKEQRFAVYVTRVAQRQWRRAFTWEYGGRGRAVEFTIPNRWFVENKLGIVVPDRAFFHSHMAKEMFDPKYPSFDEATGMIAAGEALSVAVSPAIILSGYGEKMILYYRGNRAGYVIEGGRVFEPEVNRRMAERIVRMCRHEPLEVAEWS